MSLINIMYHHLNSDRCSNNVEIFEEHLKYIKSNFTPIFAGEEVNKKCVCLTFDDAYADFYFLTFPLLKKYGIKAILAVPSKYILDDTNVSPETRMGFEHNDLFQNYEKATFCTFKELKEMIDSGLVQIASHSHSHVVLTGDGVDLKAELKDSKEILAQTLQEYKFAFRIGNAVHEDFSGINGVIYRINGDGLKNASEIFSFKNMLKYKFKALLKRLSKK